MRRTWRTIATAVHMPGADLEHGGQDPGAAGAGDRRERAKGGVDRIKRAGIVNAMHDENFRNAVKATGKQVVVAGITTEVASYSRSLRRLEEG
jgi:hypothetical protein